MPQFLNRHASLASFIAVLALWELACRTLAIPVFVLPAPSLIATAAADMGLVRWGEHLAATLQVAVIGYLAAIAIVVTLGAGVLPRVVITTLIAFFPMVISTATGLAAVPAELIELSRSLRAPRSREYTQIRLPYAVPYIFAALKVSITLAVIGAVVAEFVAAEKGLGYLILFATSSFKVPLAFASLAILVCSSLLLYGLIVWLHRRLFPWSL